MVLIPRFLNSATISSKRSMLIYGSPPPSKINESTSPSLILSVVKTFVVQWNSGPRWSIATNAVNSLATDAGVRFTVELRFISLVSELTGWRIILRLSIGILCLLANNSISFGSIFSA